MIYKKAVNFPFPVLSNDSGSYVESEFVFEAELKEQADIYMFTLNYELPSQFLNQLIEDGKAQVILIIQSKDNLFFKLDKYQRVVEIDKSRVSFNYRTSIQLHIQLLEDISFQENNDLTPFYDQVKSEIKVSRNSILGYSNIIAFESFKEPFVLFERKHIPDLKSDIKIELGSETIIIQYKDKNYLFNGINQNHHLINSYIYTGLHVALLNFVFQFGGADEFVDLMEFDKPETGLDSKLYHLMTSKMVIEINKDNIDEIIYLISDRIIEKYADAVRGLTQREN